LESRHLIAVDASRPWMAAVAADLPLLAASDPRAALSRAAHQRGITTASGLPLVFVAADDAPASTAYEAHIAATGRVPTRLNAHDLLNALAWLAFPRSKARLNALQWAAIARDGVGACRGGLRDAATLVDESGAILATEDPWVVHCLRERRWRELFTDGRARWDGVRVLAFGHALMEKLATPYKAITAHVLVVPRPASTEPGELDADVANSLDENLVTSTLMPLPVLGIPRWWAANEDPAFYDDALVFRAARAGSAGTPRG
jgi:hypothetical protein